jgi:hypothetical protein
VVDRVPANRRWFTRLAVARFVYTALDNLDHSFHRVTEARKKLLEVRRMLMAEKD